MVQSLTLIEGTRLWTIMSTLTVTSEVIVTMTEVTINFFKDSQCVHRPSKYHPWQLRHQGKYTPYHTQVREFTSRYWISVQVQNFNQGTQIQSRYWISVLVLSFSPGTEFQSRYWISVWVRSFSPGNKFQSRYWISVRVLNFSPGTEFQSGYWISVQVLNFSPGNELRARRGS